MSSEPFVFQTDSDGRLSVESAVFQALGAATLCWEHTDALGIFDSDRAQRIGLALLSRVEDADKPNLGLATTRALLTELLARAEVGGYADYRTVDN